jgi:T5SS/PEP-CTERM-associated repeat protein
MLLSEPPENRMPGEKALTSFVWNGGNGTYTTQGNWTPGSGPPGPDDQATIAQSGVLVTDGFTPFIIGDTLDGSLLVEDSATMQLLSGTQLIVGDLAGANGTLTIAAGGTFLDAPGTLADEIGETVGASGTVSVVGTNSKWLAGGRIFVGDSGNGTLLVSNGGFVSATSTGSSNGQSIAIGESAASSGFVEATGTATSITAFGRIGVGVFGTGELEILAGATVSADSVPNANHDQIFVGGNPGASGTIIVSGSGSELTADGGAIGIGVPGTATGALATGTLIVTAGGTVLGGTASEANQAGFRVGNQGSISSSTIVSEGFVTLDGSGTSLSVQGGARIGDSGSAVFVMSNGATGTLGNDPGTTDGGIIFAAVSGSTAQGTIETGASLEGFGNITIGNNGNANVLIESGGQMSGTLDAADNAAQESGINIGSNGGNSTLTVTGAGSAISTNGNILVGRGGVGTLVVANGGSAATSQAVRIGWGSGAHGNGVLLVSGSNAVLSTQTLSDGADASGTLAIGVGDLVVQQGGDVLVGAIGSLAGGAQMVVASGSGIEIGGTSDALNGEVNIDAGGILTGDGTVVGGIVDNGVINATGGLLQLQSGILGSGSLQIQQSGILELGLGLSSTNNVVFTGAGMLKLDSPLSFQGTITAPPLGGTIDVVGVANASATIIGNELQVIGGGVTYDFALQGSFGAISTSADGGVGTLAGTDVAIACFAGGTHIRTNDGDVKVEDLTIGQLVATAGPAGPALRPIRWIGHRSYSNRFVRNDPAIMPVCITRGALGQGLPTADLMVSPEHAMFLDGVLVPAKLLINGHSIHPVGGLDQIDYYHVELDSHDILLAEGAPTESFVDCDSRAMFQNAAEFSYLYPEAAAPRWSFCAPRIEDGERLAAIQFRLLHRTLPVAIGDAASLHLDTANQEGCSGWAWVPDDPAVTVEVEILVDGGVIGRVAANRLRADVRDAGFGTGRYGFVFSFAGRLSPHWPHRVAIRAVGASGVAATIELAGPPALGPDSFVAMSAALQTGRVGEVGAFLLDQWRRIGGRPLQLPGNRPLALVIDDVLPTPTRDAGSAAIASHMRALVRLGYQVVFVPVAQNFVLDRTVPGLPEIGCASEPDFSSVEDALRQHRDAALVYVHRVGNMMLYGHLIRHICPKARLLYSVADLHFLRVGRQAAIEESGDRLAESRRLREQELAAVRLADVSITHSHHETALVRQLVSGADIRTVVWEIEPHPVTRAFDERSGIVFVGGAAHTPNRDAVAWLAGEIMPRVAALDPTICCSLVGADLPSEMWRMLPDNMVALDHVPHIARVYQTARLTVAPLRFGAGVKGKVVESFAAGLPCVMSPVAAEGFSLPSLLTHLVAAEPDEIARIIIRMHSDAKANDMMAGSGVAFVAEQWSAVRVDEALGAAVASGRTPLVGRRVRTIS